MPAGWSVDQRNNKYRTSIDSDGEGRTRGDCRPNSKLRFLVRLEAAGIYHI